MRLRLPVVGALIAAVACTAPRRAPRHVAPAPITEGDGVALGSEVELTLDTDPTVIHEVIDFRIADPSLVDGAIVPSQGLVLVAREVGRTTAELRTTDGLIRTITIVVKPSVADSETVIEVFAGEIYSLGEDAITDWTASPPGNAIVVPSTNSPGFSVVASEAGDVLLLLRTEEGARIVRLHVRAIAAEADASTPLRLINP